MSDTQDRIKEWGKYAWPGYSLNLRLFVPQRSLILEDAIVFLNPGWCFYFLLSYFPGITVEGRELVKWWRCCTSSSSLGLISKTLPYPFTRYVYEQGNDDLSICGFLPRCVITGLSQQPQLISAWFWPTIFLVHTPQLSPPLSFLIHWCLLHNGKAVYVLNAGSAGHRSVSKLTEIELGLKYY